MKNSLLPRLLKSALLMCVGIAIGAGVVLVAKGSSGTTRTVTRTVAQGAPGVPSANGSAGSGPALPSTGPRPAPIIGRPPGLSRAKPVPLVIALHASGGDPLTFLKTTGFDHLAIANGFVIAYLATLPPASPAWRRVDIKRNLAYISSEIRKLIPEQNIDPKRVYIFGFSAGASMAYAAACMLSSQLDGVAAVSGAMLHVEPCPVTHPIPELAIMGTSDPYVPVNGGQNILSASQVAAKWRAIDGCTATATRNAAVGPVQEQTWASCKGNAAVGLDLINGGLHYYPGAKPIPGVPPIPSSSPDSQFDASQAIWAFFAAHGG